MSFDVLFFEVRGRRCALPISVVREVLAAPAITPVPLSPPTLRGLVPVHGQVLPLIDIGPQLAGSPGEASGVTSLRWDGDRIIVIEAPLDPGAIQDQRQEEREDGRSRGRSPEGGETTTAGRLMVRAALVVHRVTRLGTLDEGHARPPPAGPGFVTATLLDVEGPALLIDAAGAMQALQQSLRQGVVS
jgi:chemotaxis signal transduction protein